MENTTFLRSAANAVFRQVSFNPTGPGIPVDPEVADFMGAFEETALTLDDLVDDALLHRNGGEIFYED